MALSIFNLIYYTNWLCQLATKTDAPLTHKIDPPSSFIF